MIFVKCVKWMNEWKLECITSRRIIIISLVLYSIYWLTFSEHNTHLKIIANICYVIRKWGLFLCKKAPISFIIIQDGIKVVVFNRKSALKGLWINRFLGNTQLFYFVDIFNGMVSLRGVCLFTGELPTFQWVCVVKYFS